MNDIYRSEERVEHGRRVRVDWCFDHDMKVPWGEHDGHGPVRRSEGPHRRHDGKHPGERPLNNPDRSEWQYYYDWQEAIKIAKRDGWGLGEAERTALAQALKREPTKGDVAHAAVERDFTYLQAWCNDDWHWCSVQVTDVETDVEASLWGIESDSDEAFFDETISDLADGMWEEVCEALLRGARAA